MKRINSVLGMLAAAVAALLIVPLGTAAAAPRAGLTAGDVHASVTGADSQTVSLRLAKGTFTTVGSTLKVANAQGVTTETINLNHKVGAQVVPLRASVSKDHQSVDLSPMVKQHRRQVSSTKDKAWNDLMMKANRNWPCAAPATIIGFVIGLFIPFWIVTLPLATAIGAYIGYSNCGVGKARGETVRAFNTWMSTP